MSIITQTSDRETPVCTCFFYQDLWAFVMMWILYLVIFVVSSIEGLSESDSALIVIDSLNGDIFHMDLNNSRVTSIPVANMVSPVAIDLDPSEELMFWTDISDQIIKRSTLTGDSETVIKNLSVDASPEGLAVDWKAKLLFYTDDGEDKIVRMDYDGGSEVTIVTSLDQPLGIALDYDSRLMYWTDYGQVPKIEVATYDGNDRRALVESTDMVSPKGLTINREEQILYWCDASLGRIESIKTDGTNRKLLTIDLGSRFFGIVYFEDYLYTTSWDRAYIQGMHKNGDTLLNISDSFLLFAEGITAYGPVNVDTTPTSSTTISLSSTSAPTTPISEDSNSGSNTSDRTTSVYTNFIMMVAVVVSASLSDLGSYV